MIREPVVPQRGWYVTKWDSLLSLSHFRLLWRLVLDDKPLPVAIAVDPPGAGTPIPKRARYEQEAIQQLVQTGYLVQDRALVQPNADVVRLLRPLADPDRLVRIQIVIRGVVVNRGIAAFGHTPRAVLVEVRGGMVVLTEVDTPSPAVAAASLLPLMPVGRLNLRPLTGALELAEHQLHAADSVGERRRFLRALEHHVSSADAVELFTFTCADSWLDASFAVGSGTGVPAGAANVVVVRGTHEHGCHVLSRKGDRTIIEPAHPPTVESRITDLLNRAGAAR